MPWFATDCKGSMKHFNVGTGQEVIAHIEAGARPDVVILDLNMPDLDGHDTAKWLQLNHPEMHVLMLTMYDSELSLIRLLQAGVKGFLKKRYSPRRTQIRNSLSG